jgi:hypothetical protein
LNDDKVYCFEHLEKQHMEGGRMGLLLRQPNQDREYILEMFGTSEIEEEKEDVRRGRGKAN